MSSKISKQRQKLLEELDQASQDLGNLNVLHTTAIASRVGLSASEFECLARLREGPMTAGQLARLSGLTSGAITGLIDRMERLGYAERVSDPSDRRRVLVRLKSNPALGRKIRKLYEPLGQAFDQLTANYSEEELRLIFGYVKANNAIFQKLTENLARQRPKK